MFRTWMLWWVTATHRYKIHLILLLHFDFIPDFPFILPPLFESDLVANAFIAFLQVKRLVRKARMAFRMARIEFQKSIFLTITIQLNNCDILLKRRQKVHNSSLITILSPTLSPERSFSIAITEKVPKKS